MFLFCGVQHVGIFNELEQMSGSGKENPFSFAKKPSVNSLDRRGDPVINDNTALISMPKKKN